jgi:hypothetical protein
MLINHDFGDGAVPQKMPSCRIPAEGVFPFRTERSRKCYGWKALDFGDASRETTDAAVFPGGQGA